MTDTGQARPFISNIFEQLNKQAGYLLRYEHIIFIFLLLLNLAPVWLEKYILNSDGPAHTYTAHVLLDYFRGKNTELYKQYFQLKLVADPNWFSRFWLMFLQVFFSWRIAEKILVSAYLLLFPIVFRKLIGSINPSGKVLSLFIFPFLSHYVFNYGFYNYSFGIVFLFAFLIFWVKYQGQLNTRQVLAGALFCTLAYFTHLWCFIFIGLFTGCLIATDTATELLKGGWVPVIKQAALKALKFAVMMLPGLILALWFIKKFLLAEEPDHVELPELTTAFLKLEALEIYSVKEFIPATYTANALLSLAIVSIVTLVWRRKWSGNIAFLICALAGIALYFAQPEKLTVGAFWIGRMSLIGYLFLIIWAASVNQFACVKMAFGLFAVFINIYLLVLHLPYYRNVSLALEEYLSIAEKIPPYSTVLPLSFNHKGTKPDGTDVCPDFWKFNHAFDYACIDKQLVTFSHNDWIPLLWKPERNPFTKIGNLEFQPPEVNFGDYNWKSNGGKVEYVVTWCMDKNHSGPWQGGYVKKQLDEHYMLIDSSAHNLARLYRLKM